MEDSGEESEIEGNEEFGSNGELQYENEDDTQNEVEDGQQEDESEEENDSGSGNGSGSGSDNTNKKYKVDIPNEEDGDSMKDFVTPRAQPRKYVKPPPKVTRRNSEQSEEGHATVGEVQKRFRRMKTRANKIKFEDEGV